jgi:hypothetical protein
MPTQAQQIANLRAALLQRDCTLEYIADVQNGVIARTNEQWVPLTTEQQTANALTQA